MGRGETQDSLNIHALSGIFSHKRIMASYAIKTIFLPNSIGYIDQFPFVNINRKVKYPTWRMSWDVGGINTDIMTCFKGLHRIEDFGYLINSNCQTRPTKRSFLLFRSFSHYL